MYNIDFDNETMSLLHKGFDETKLPSKNERYKPYYSEKEYGDTQKKYNELIQSYPSLPKATFSTGVAQIDEDTFFVVAGEGALDTNHYDSKFVIVDVKQGKVIQELELSSMCE